MRASLIYVVDGEEYVLEKAGMEFLDQFTFRNFKNKNDIFSYSRYSDILDKLPKDGEFYVRILHEDLTLVAAQYLRIFGRDPFDIEQLFDVVYKSDEDSREKLFETKKHVLKLLLDVDVLEEFYNKTYGLYNAQERFFHEIGLVYEDYPLMSKGVHRVINDAFDDWRSYDIKKIFLEGISRFDSMNKKNAEFSKK